MPGSSITTQSDDGYQNLDNNKIAPTTTGGCKRFFSEFFLFLVAAGLATLLVFQIIMISSGTEVKV